MRVAADRLRWRDAPSVSTALVLLAGVTGGAIVAALGRFDVYQQVAAVVLLGLAVPAAMLMVARPHVAVAGYLCVLPLLLDWGVGAGLNAGEALTLVMLVWGVVSLWEAHGRIEPAVRALWPLIWPLMMLALVSVVSLAVNGITAFQEVAGALLKMIAFALMAILVHMHADTPAKASRLLTAALVGAVGVAVYAVVAYVAGWSYDEVYDWNRAAGTFEHWNQLGGFMALMGMPALALAIASRSPAGRLAWAGAFALMMAALLLSQTLGSVLALIVAFGIAGVFLVRIGWGRLFAAGLLLAASFAVVFATNEELRDKVLHVDERVMDRLRTYAVGVAMFRDRLWFGFGSEERLTDELWFGEADYGLTMFGASSSVPHNAFLQIGVEKGIFGAVLFAIVIVGALRILLRHRRVLMQSRHSLLYQGIAVGVIAFLVQNMTNSIALHARIGIVFFALIALVDRLGTQTSSEPASS